MARQIGGDFMRISDRYIGTQVLFGTLYAVLILGVVLVLGNLFKEIQRLLVELKAPLELVLRFVISVLPMSLTYTVPWGFLSAVLIVFGRLSSNHEITSFRVAGMSLVRLAAPVFVIGAALSALSLWLNTSIVPDSKASSKQVIYQLGYDQAVKDPGSMLKPGVVQGNLKGDDKNLQKLMIEGKSGDWVEGFHLYELPDASPKKSKDKLLKNAPEVSNEMTYIYARRAALEVDPVKKQLRIKLQDAHFEERNAKGETFSGLAKEIDHVIIDIPKLGKSNKLRPSAMSNAEIRQELASNKTLDADKQLDMHNEIVGRYAFSMACLAFAFIAVPLGLQSRRKDNSRGLILSLLIGGAYFLITILADQSKNPSVAMFVLWLPNVICVLVGLFLFRRARFG